MNRRELLIAAAGLAALGGGLGALFVTRHNRANGLLLAACDDDSGHHFFAACSADGRERYRLPLPQRGHGISATPDGSLAVCFARRPGTQFHVFDLREQRLIKTVSSIEHHHYYGHGVFSRDGRYLFATENDYRHGRGVIGVYDAGAGFARVASFDSGGIDPHELALLSDGHTLVIANGGILTHPESPRENLNIDSMQPKLAYVDSRDGQLLDSFAPPHAQMSVRHLAVSADDRVLIGVQYEGHPSDEIPLVLSHRGESELQPLQATTGDWQEMKQYTASVAVDASGRLGLTTSPRGGVASLWDLRAQRLLGSLPVTDVAGAAFRRSDGMFVLSSGFGELLTMAENRHDTLKVSIDTHWDNHMLWVG